MIRAGRVKFGFVQSLLEWSLLVGFGLECAGAGHECSGNVGHCLGRFRTGQVRLVMIKFGICRV